MLVLSTQMWRRITSWLHSIPTPPRLLPPPTLHLPDNIVYLSNSDTWGSKRPQDTLPRVFPTYSLAYAQLPLTPLISLKSVLWRGVYCFLTCPSSTWHDFVSLAFDHFLQAPWESVTHKTLWPNNIITVSHLGKKVWQATIKTKGTYNGVETYVGDISPTDISPSCWRGKGAERKIERHQIQWLSTW